MFKNLLIATALTAALTTTAFASEGKASGFVEVASDALYRGQSISQDKPAVSVGLRADNLVVDGTFVSVTGTTTSSLSNLDSDSKIRTEIAVGYGKTFADRYSVGASVVRVQNPVLYADDYTEVRVDGAVRLTDKLFATGEYAQILTDKVGNDKYAALGLEYKGLVVPELSVGGKLSYQDYDFRGRSEFNNAELFATYAVTKNVEAFASYSWGGKSITHATDAFSFLDYRASSLRDQGNVGVRVRF
jgi:uncharacterized protein (TIGR02001 family)